MIDREVGTNVKVTCLTTGKLLECSVRSEPVSSLPPEDTLGSGSPSKIILTTSYCMFSSPDFDVHW